MPVNLTINGVTFQYPVKRDKNWGQQATAWAQAVTAGMLQKAGGTFSLTADVDFGASFGVKSLYYKSRSSPLASAGQLRLARVDTIKWRNEGDAGDNTLSINAADQLLYNGVQLATAAGDVQGPAGATDEALARFDGGTGKILQNSLVLVTDLGAMSGITTLTADDVITDSVTTDEVTLPTGMELTKALAPIGSIIPFYDFNAALTFDTTYWVYCDGTSQTIGGVPRTTPDLSNRYLVGFGTEGGGDIDTAAWSTLPVGNASHQVNIAHTHTVDIASFASGAGGGHDHASGDLYAQIGNSQLASDGRLHIDFTAVASWTPDRRISSLNDDGASSTSQSNGVDVGGTTSSVADHTHTIDPPSAASNSALSATQDVQPRSIRVRFIMRAK